MPALLKKLLPYLTIFFLFFIFLLPTNVAASTGSGYDYSTSQNSGYKTQTILIEVTSAFICQLVGVDPINPAKPCLAINRLTNKIDTDPTFSQNQTKIGGLMGGVIALISHSYDVPVHTSDYTSYLSSNFGLVKPAYAQSTGFDNLKGLLQLWKRVRDLTYLAFVLIFVLIGLGVMLRVKLDPRTVMTLQNQIPKIIISIILITFSYAIVGLAIDGMWVVTHTGINLISGDSLCEDGSTTAAKTTSFLLDNPIHFANNVLGCPWGANKSTTFELGWRVGQTLGDIVSQMILGVLGIDPGVDLDRNCRIITDGLGTCVKKAIDGVLSGIIGVVAALAVIIAILVQLFRIWFSLVKSYVMLLLYTIMAPVWILVGLVPGSTNFGFRPWLRRVLFSLSIYPATIFLFLVAVVLLNQDAMNNPSDSFIPPLIGNPNIADNMGYILGLGVILITPQVIEMMREIFKVSPSKYAPAAFAALGAGAGVAQNMTKPIFGRRKDGSYAAGSYYARRAVQSIPGVKNVTDRWNRFAIRTGLNDPEKNKKIYTNPSTGQVIVDDGSRGGSGQNNNQTANNTTQNTSTNTAPAANNTPASVNPQVTPAEESDETGNGTDGSTVGESNEGDTGDSTS